MSASTRVPWGARGPAGRRGRCAWPAPPPPRASGARRFRGRGWSPGACSADLSVRVQRPAAAQEWRRLTSPPKMTVRASPRRARSAASSTHCASFPATSVVVRVFRWAVHTSTFDSGGHAQPPAPLDAGLCLECSAVGALDGCRGEHRLTEESAAARSNAAEALAAVNHPREAQVVTRPPGRHGIRLAHARADTRLSRSLVRSAR
jgi:hypothetical protein